MGDSLSFLPKPPGNGFLLSSLASRCRCRARGDSLGELRGWPGAAQRPTLPARLAPHLGPSCERRGPGSRHSPAAARPAGSTSTSDRGPSRPPPGTPPPPPWRAGGCGLPVGDRAPGDGEGRPGLPGVETRARTGWGCGPGPGGTPRPTASRGAAEMRGVSRGAASPLPVRSDRDLGRAVGWRAEGKEEVGAARAATGTRGRGPELHAAPRGVRPFAHIAGVWGRSEFWSLRRRGPGGSCSLSPQLSFVRFVIKCTHHAARHPLREVPTRPRDPLGQGVMVAKVFNGV